MSKAKTRHLSKYQYYCASTTSIKLQLHLIMDAFYKSEKIDGNVEFGMCEIQ